MSRRPLRVGDLVAIRDVVWATNKEPGDELETWAEQVREYGHPQRAGDVGVVNAADERGVRITFARTGEDPDWWGADWLDLVEEAHDQA